MPCFIGKLTALKRRRFLRRAHGGLVQAEEYVGPDFGVQIQKKQQRRAPFCRAAVACRAEPKVRAVFRHGKAAESRVFPCHAPQLLQCAVGGAVVGENKVQLLQRILHGGQRGHTCAQPFHAVVGHHHDIITHGVFSLFIVVTAPPADAFIAPDTAAAAWRNYFIALHSKAIKSSS